MSSAYLLLVLFTLACKRNNNSAPNPQDQNEEELITTVSLIIKEGSTLVDTFSFRDVDGVGGASPTIEQVILSANKTYSCTLLLLDESKNPTDTISAEVEEEKNEHQFFFHPSGGANLTITYDDADDNGVPLGLLTTFTTGAISTGKLGVVLKHQPDVKPTSGNGNESLGETDVEVEFDVVIQ